MSGEQSLRLALLSPCFWPEVRRGTERFTRDLADGLLAHGHRPSLITSHPWLPTYGVEQGLPITRLPRPPQGRLLRRGYEPYLTHLPFSYLALRASHVDLAHAVYPADALVAARWGKRSGKPAVLSYMGIPNRPGLREKRKRLEILLSALRACDAVVALSNHSAAAFRYWLGYEPRVIPPGVNLQAFTPGSRSSQPTIVCGAAVEEPRKHVGLLVEAFRVVRREVPGARLVLSRPRKIELARQAGIDIDAPGLEWADLDDRRALAKAYAEAWVAALPSWHEAFGLVLVEAMACGTPVVGAAHGAVPEVIGSSQVGRLFDQLEPPAVASAILEAFELSSSPETAAHCRARAAEFSTERCTERYLALYRELLS